MDSISSRLTVRMRPDGVFTMIVVPPRKTTVPLITVPSFRTTALGFARAVAAADGVFLTAGLTAGVDPRTPVPEQRLQRRRLILLTLTESFYGKEDLNLKDRLHAELPGILNWSIEGWKRLRERGHFKQPKSSRDLVQELEDLASPISAFIRDCCDLDPYSGPPNFAGKAPL